MLLQRRNYKLNKLSEDKVQRLEVVGFNFTLGPSKKVSSGLPPAQDEYKPTKDHHGKDWDARYKNLIKFAEKHGHANVPLGCESDRNLGLWVHAQRLLHSQRKFSEDHFDYLELLEFDFTVPKENTRVEEDITSCKKRKHRTGVDI